MREYHWIRLYHDDSEWIIAEHNSDGTWSTPGDGNYWAAHQFAEIGPIITDLPPRSD